MTLILSGTDGLSDVDGTAATPALRGTDANTGIFFPAADTIAFSEGGAEVARFDSSGNLGIGTSSPSTYANGFAPVLVAGTGNNFATVQGRTDGPSGAANGVSYGGSYQTNAINGARMFVGAAGSGGQRGIITFNTKDLDDNTTQPLERARIDSSGNFLVGTTSTTPNPGVALFPNGAISQGNSAGSSGYEFLSFRRSATQIGSVTQNGTTAVAFNTSSDYRLKEAIAPMTGALAKVVALKPCTYKWKIDGSDGQGFIAHELAEVVPQCVSGEKDAVETYTDEDGNEQTRPKYQGIDTSFLVATLTAAIQEQQALITALTTRITALESK